MDLRHIIHVSRGIYYVPWSKSVDWMSTGDTVHRTFLATKFCFSGRICLTETNTDIDIPSG